MPSEIYRHFHDDEHELAYRFARGIRSYHTAEEMAEVNRRNAVETNPAICHSHDYYDANTAMLAALYELGMELDVQSEAQTALTDAAWAIARAAGFDAQRIYDEAQAAGTRTLGGNGSYAATGPTN